MRVASVEGRAVLVVGDGIVDVASASAGSLPADPPLLYERWDDVRALAQRVAEPDAALDARRVEAPVPRPRQVFAIGMNYAAHAAEAGMEAPTFPPTLTKFPTCLTGPDATVELPSEFVVPGQDRASALLDVARTVVRRSERAAAAVAADGSHVVPYLNRLSTLLWTLARWVEGDALPSKSH